MWTLEIKPTHKVVTAYYDNLAKFDQLGVKHEGAVRSAFQELLEHSARQSDWKLVPEHRLKAKSGSQVQVDGGLLDMYGLPHGYWEAKDSDDDLDKEIKNKFAAGYPRDNILFQEPRRAVLFQQGQCIFGADLTRPDDLVHVLKLFLEYAPPAIAEWEKAVTELKERVPQIGKSLKALIEKERQTNKKFIAAFEDFCALCRGSLNPNISLETVEEMIIQHILTERIFRKIFDVADFISRNVIAQEIEKVISALTSRSFSRDDFAKSLDHFYVAIENAAATIQKEAQIMKERGKKVLALIPLNLDGFLFSDEYQSGKKSEIKSRVAANFVDWEKDHALFDRELKKVIRALRADDAGRERPPRSRL